MRSGLICTEVFAKQNLFAQRSLPSKIYLHRGLCQAKLICTEVFAKQNLFAQRSLPSKTYLHRGLCQAKPICTNVSNLRAELMVRVAWSTEESVSGSWHSSDQKLQGFWRKITRTVTVTIFFSFFSVGYSFMAPRSLPLIVIKQICKIVKWSCNIWSSLTGSKLLWKCYWTLTVNLL